MAIDLKSLKASFSKLSNKFKNRATFTIEDVTVVMELLNPQQEADCQKYALEILGDLKEGEDASQPYLLMYWDRMRARLLSYSIKELNGEVLPEYIETGEFMKDKKPIRMERSKVLLGIISEWSRPLIHSFFFSYGKMAEESEIEADKYINYSSKNIDTQIELLESRLERLRQSKIQQVKDASSQITAQVENINKLEEARRQERQDIINSSSPIRTSKKEESENKSTEESVEESLETKEGEKVSDDDILNMMSSPLKKPVNPEDIKPVEQQKPLSPHEKGSFSKPVADETTNFIPPRKNENAPEKYYEPPKPKNWDEEPIRPLPQSPTTPVEVKTIDKIREVLKSGSMDQFMATVQVKDQTYIRRFGIEKYAQAVDNGTILQWRAASDNTKKKSSVVPSPISNPNR